MMRQLEDLDYADDIALISSTWTQAQTKLERLGSNSEGTGLKINVEKTKVLRLNARRQDPLMINGIDVEDTDSFVYLGATVNNLGGAEQDIRSRLGKHREALVVLDKEVDVVKGKIEEKKLEGGESMDEVCTWSNEIDAKIEGVDAEIEYLGRHLSESRQKLELAKREGEEALLEREREKQLKFEKEKLEMKLGYEEKSAELRKGNQGESSDSHAKLPKLSVTKYDGTYEQWLPFWNKFCAEIESTNLAPVTKFTYLKELLQPQVRADIDGLPFKYHEKALMIRKKIFGEEDADVAISYNNLGIVYRNLGQYNEAKEYYEKAVIIRKQIFGEEHADVAISYNSLGVVYRNIGQYNEAKEYYENALIIRKKIFDEENADIASFSNLGSVYQDVEQVSGEELCQVSANYCNLETDNDNYVRQRNQRRTKFCVLF
ncbi:kinesin light chain-like [Orbicella faveolata]|uniref:kinesin light chain-like n=1 Tax=Orbicella faveolata TaxID=48498 RepID=UPI0009E49228|nr:kinesin light chain-like [Orbicella faveolata]